MLKHHFPVGAWKVGSFNIWTRIPQPIRWNGTTSNNNQDYFQSSVLSNVKRVECMLIPHAECVREIDNEPTVVLDGFRHPKWTIGEGACAWLAWIRPGMKLFAKGGYDLFRWLNPPKSQSRAESSILPMRKQLIEGPSQGHVSCQIWESISKTVKAKFT